VKSKYVIIECGRIDGVMVFSPFLMHKDMAGKHKVVSAGYCELNENGRWVVDGGSLSLEYRSRPQDVDILNNHLTNIRQRPSHFLEQVTNDR